MRKKIDGSITVFLVLVFLLILSVVLVGLESARVSGIKSSMTMACSSSINSILADYYKPLFEEYRIFGRENEKGLDDIKEQVEDYLTYVSNPLDGLKETKAQSFSTLPVQIEQISIDQIQSLMDGEAYGYYSQACEAMKYEGIQMVLDGMLKKCNMILELDGASKAFKMQTDTMSELAKLDELSMQLMEVIDGIHLKDGKIQFESNGRIKAKKVFVKKYVPFPIDSLKVGINHSFVYESLKDHYKDRDNLYIASESLIDQIIELEGSIHTYETECLSLEESIRKIDEEIASLESGKENHSDNIKDLQKERKDLSKNLEDEQKAMESAKKDKSKCEKELKKDIKQIDEEITALKKVILDAIQLTEKGIEQQENAKESLEQYENQLEGMKDEVAEPVKESLFTELENMKGYTGDSSKSTSVNYNYRSMKDTLEYDYSLLDKEIRGLSDVKIDQGGSELERAKELLEKNQEVFSTYSIACLDFDYSTINLEQSKDKSVIDTMKAIIDDGILGIVLEDSEQISKNSLENTLELPSKIATIQYADSDMDQGIGNLGILDESILSDLLDSFSKLSSSDGDLASFATDITQIGLFQLYVNEFFKDYTVDEEPSIETVLYPSVLDYEKEYICFHKDSDKENLVSMIYQLFLIRLIVNMIEIFSNPDCVKKAKLTATTLVAFTGLTILITITKLLILTAWAVMETLVDVTILLKNKKLEVMNQKKQHISYGELLTMSKSKIHEKAKSYQSKSSVSMDYDDYLFLFLLLQSKKNKCYSSMDLIQENLNKRYEGTFQFEKSIYGIRAQINYRIHRMFAIGADFNGGIPCKRELFLSY